jgi:hypothetical protein
MADTLNNTQVNADSGKQRDNTANWKRLTSTWALILMGLTTLGSSWCGYQANLWNGIQTFHLVDSAEFSRNANEKAMKAAAQKNLDAALFVEYAQDLSDNQTQRANFFLERMRPELQNAVKAWVALHPIKNEGAPSTPFAMPQYHLNTEADVTDLNLKAKTAHDQAQSANVASDTYALLTVLHASALFLAGLVSTIDERRTRLITLFMSVVVFTGATIILLHLPKAKIG